MNSLPDELVVEILLCQNPVTIKLINRRINRLYRTYHNLIWGNFIAANNNINYLALSVVYEPGILRAILLSKYCTKEFIHSQIPDYHSSYKGKGHTILHLAAEHSPESTKLILEYCDEILFNKQIFESKSGAVTYNNSITPAHIAAQKQPIAFNYIINSKYCNIDYLKIYKYDEYDKLFRLTVLHIAICYNFESLKYLLQSIYGNELIDLPIRRLNGMYQISSYKDRDTFTFVCDRYNLVSEKWKYLDMMKILYDYYPKAMEEKLSEELKMLLTYLQ